MKRLPCLAAIFICSLAIRAQEPADEADNLTPKAALQALNDFIGDWKGSGSPDTARPQKGDTWSEDLTWSWRFKGNDIALIMTVKNGKLFKSGDLKYLPDKKKYELTMVDKDGGKATYLGEMKNGSLVVERVDPDSKETQRLSLYSAAEGVRFIYRQAHKAADRTNFTKDFMVAFTKEGESFAATEAKVECPVTGGLGKIAVSYNGTTYYVCCSGCKDAFEENPAKYVKEFEARKKKKK